MAARPPARKPSVLPPPDGETLGAEVTREKLLQAAHELLYERAGEPVTVSEICARAGANVAMVKYCFGSKDGLLDALVERLLSQLTGEIDRLDALGLPPGEALRRHVAEMVRNYVRFPYVNRLLNERLVRGEPDTVDRLSRAYAEPTRAWYARLLAEGHRDEGWREVDPTFFFFTVIGACEFLFSARTWLERSFAEPMDQELVERFVTHTTELVLAGLGGRPA